MDVQTSNHGGIVSYPLEEQSMPFENLHAIIAIAFTAVWLMVGQFAFSKT